MLSNNHVQEQLKKYVDDAKKDGKANVLYGSLRSDKQREMLRQILSIPFDGILTTNYSYELEEAAINNTTISQNRLILMSTHTSAVKNVEPKYLLHSYNQFVFQGIEKNVWLIHGEARKPNSIIIGHDYYGKLFGRINKYLDGQKNRYFDIQREGKENVIKSWIDAFILGDVYAVGFGYDYSEFDLWWLLNRKKRENAEHGKLYFYEPQKVADGTVDEKVELLRTLGAEIESFGLNIYGVENDACDAEYRRFYKVTCEYLEKTIGMQQGCSAAQTQ